MQETSRVYELEDTDEPIREILGKVPRWIIRWGNTLVFLFFVSLITLSLIIKYPESVYSIAKLTSINPPKPIIPLTSGKLIKLFVKEGQSVQAREIIGFIECRASHAEVIELSEIIDSLQTLISDNKTECAPEYLSKKYQNLGEVQQPYQTFMQNFSIFKQYLSQGYYLKKKSMLLEDIEYMKKLHATLLEQKRMQQEDLGLADTTLKMNKRLKEQNVIASLEYRNEKSKYINKALVIPQINLSITNNESNQHEKEKEIMQLENDIAQQKDIFIQALNTLKSQIEDWKSKYLLTAPISGKVAFANFLQENQQLSTNQTVCFVNPENTSYYAEMFIPQSNFGKVAIGQKVLLKFSAYPFQEFGSVYGNISFISSIPTDSGYLAKVQLPQGLKTNYQKQVQYRDGLLAQGEIITKDMRLLQRFVINIIGKMKK